MLSWRGWTSRLELGSWPGLALKMGKRQLGALLLRGAGCTINDLVARTRSRPIASGVLSPFRGLCFLGFQLLLGLEILLQLNNYSRVLGASSLLLVFSYPLMKRLTYWVLNYDLDPFSSLHSSFYLERGQGDLRPILDLTFNWGALLGWAAVRGSLDLSVVIPLYASGVFWTLVYDTIYAHQDKEDDMRVGVKSTALRFGDSTKVWISGFGAACISSLALSGHNANLEWPYYVFLAAGSTQLAWQIFTVDLSSRADCYRKCVPQFMISVVYVYLYPINGLELLSALGFFLEETYHDGINISIRG
ncbi:hypothetical protein SASPL_126621 [Salvia splendens]|uniref:4-hydroxybenzoate polyprenyltransferase n=1 Tax=Salvia splendens TaxID=180675 RepID=A0A8X8ZRB9_SALSN|nr:hypothetical protein SASPL_126621 [Salvia splendens]